MVTLPQVSLEQIRQEVIRREAKELAADFHKFVAAAWEIVEPGQKFMDGMHVRAICEHLQACAEGKIRKLLINIQPRAGKSTIVSVLYPCWVWTRWATDRFLYGSYSLELARRDSNRTRRVIETEWYRERWPHVVVSDDQNTKSFVELTSTGYRQITSVDGQTTGLGGNQLILDDPLSAKDAESEQVRATTLQWVKEAWSTRLNPGERQVQICIMQRLHQLDPAGYYLSEGDWCHLNLPTEFEGDKKPNSYGWVDPRTEFGEVLWAERYGTPQGRKELDALKKTLGAVGVAGQLQQRPVPRGGATFKQQWIKFWYDEGLGYPEAEQYQDVEGKWHDHEQKPLPRIDEGSIVNSWDLAFKGDDVNDFVVGQSWGRGVKTDRSNFYLLKQKRGNFDFVETLQAMLDLNRTCMYPPQCTLVEEKANGAAAITSLKSSIPALIAVQPEGGKESRGSAVAPMFEAGNIWLPHPKQFPWVRDYLIELLVFPRGNNDDQVDATTQALIRFRSRHVEEVDMGPSIQATQRVSPWRV